MFKLKPMENVKITGFQISTLKIYYSQSLQDTLSLCITMKDICYISDLKKYCFPKYEREREKSFIHHLLLL
jgi:hypothetical protein